MTMSDYYEDVLEDADADVLLGIGFGVGMVIRIPITDIVSIVPGVNFFYRTLRTNSNYSYEEYISESALSFPVMVQVAPIPNVPLYFAAGIQYDIPFGTKVYWEDDYEGDGDDEIKKRTNDIGLAIGLGFNIGSHMALELRSTFGMTEMTNYSNKDAYYNYFEDASFNQYAFILNAFF